MDTSWFLSPLPILLGCVVVLVTYIVFRHRRPAKFPPGPPMLPVLGSIPFLESSDPMKACAALAKKYGPVFSMALGNSPQVVLASYDSIMEACVQKGRDFGGRTNQYKFSAIPDWAEHRGIFDADYSEDWKTERHTALTVLKTLGYGKNIVQVKILEEFDHLASGASEQNGTAFNFNDHIHNAVANIICALLFGERFDYNDQDFKEIRHLNDDFFRLTMEYTGADYIPLLRLLPGHKEFMSTYRKACESIYAYIERRISEHKESDKAGQDNFIGTYLRETGREGRKKDLWLRSHLSDFFMAGMETTTTTIGWGIYYMAKYPHIQDGVQKELDELGIQKGGHVTLADKPSLPYTEATIYEIQRMANTAPIIPHKTLCDTSVAGYDIPNNTDVLMFLGAVHRDPKIWPEPEEFRPERFLDQQGQVERRDQLIPFGAGRRACLGEQLARQELFLFFTNILRTFHIRESDTTKLPPPIGIHAITYQPPKFEVCLDRRH